MFLCRVFVWNDSNLIPVVRPAKPGGGGEKLLGVAIPPRIVSAFVSGLRQGARQTAGKPAFPAGTNLADNRLTVFTGGCYALGLS